jgi:glycosyltransferase involved in cell wall biosynthesis
MTVDAVGGVWRYAMDLAAGLASSGTAVVFACLGPQPSTAQVAEAEAIGELVVLPAPLDWTARSESELRDVPRQIAELGLRMGADLLHLNAPSQAAGLESELPVLVVSHSCVVTWFRAVRGTDVPDDWRWQRTLNQQGLDAADAVVAPSRSHAELLAASYTDLGYVHVVHNSVRPIAAAAEPEPYAVAAGRWWDDGKNGRTLDRAAALASVPVRMAGSQNGPNGQYVAIEHAEALGEVKSSAVRELMAGAQMFVSPSVYEPFGLAPLEAASAGLPLVLSDIPTYRELWDGAAIFADPHDAQGFADAMDDLAASPELRATYGESAAERATQFTVTRQVDAMRGAYAAAMRHHTPARQRVHA